MESSKTILLLDGDEQSAQNIQRFLKVSAYTFNVSHASDIAEGLNYLKGHKPDIVLLDAALASRKDFASVKIILEKNKIPAILLTDTGGHEISQQAKSVGAGDYLVKNKVNLFNLQKIIVNTLKLNETEIKLDHAFEENLTLQESFIQMLNKMNEGVMVINRQNVIRYANTRAYHILGEESFRKRISGHIAYRDIDEEEVIELKGGKKFDINISISDLSWNGEKANLFVIRKNEVKEREAEQGMMETLTDLLDTLDINLLLLKGERIAFATRHTARTLLLKGDEVRRKKLEDIFESKDELNNPLTVQMLMAEQRATGVIKLADGTAREVTYYTRQMNLEDELYRLLVIEPVEADREREAPASRSDDDKFTTDGVLHLASHDLREPVRTILNYVQLISEHLRNGKYEQAAEYADFAKSEGTRMEKLLSDLKVFISLNEHPFSMAKISMKTLAADVLKSMKSVIEAAEAQVTLAELPDITADRQLVEELLMHLLDNAIKFHKKDKKPVIDIGFDKFEGNVIFCVRDNGIGISKKYSDKIFELFERLNRVDEYPGNGLGLAICKRVVEMHGGEIWIESVPGFGSNFYFTLRGK